MTDARSAPVLVAGAGIAGLTAALAFAIRGFPVQVFEQAATLEEAGAGIQLSPNATRLLRRLGVLNHLLPHSAAPEAVVLRDAGSLKELARVPLGQAAERRWGAPYLTVHRADLQDALLTRVLAEPRVELRTGTRVREVVSGPDGPRLFFGNGYQPASPSQGAGAEIARGMLVVGADGVWSKTRETIGLGASRFSGLAAWRATIGAAATRGLLDASVVTAFLHRRVHLVAYPLGGGAAINLVAITKQRMEGAKGGPTPMLEAFAGAEPRLKALLEGPTDWSVWPLHVAHPKRWTDADGLALIGDAAHAMTPFAAQGAAMAIEDAVVLADAVAGAPADLTAALASYEAMRKPRIARVARRGSLNRLAWHASGPVALVRNAVLAMRTPERLAADLDWLYGWDLEAEAGGR